MTVWLEGRAPTLEEVERVARGREAVCWRDTAREAVRRARALVEAALESAHPVYGVNTGLGRLKDRRVESADLATLQGNLVRSHAAGVGEPMATEAVRAMGFLRAASLALGASGVREALVERLLELLNAGVHPIVPSVGSVGASGDLAPLAHYALVLLGEGEAEVGGRRLPGRQALAAARLEPLALAPKEGLALVNGTQQSAAWLVLALADAERLVEGALAAAAMSLEALQGSELPFSERVAAVRPHPGHAVVAARLRVLWAGSALGAAHADCGRIQDPYSLRCLPQVVGATWDGLAFARRLAERELASVTDNPLVFADVGPERPWRERVVTAGNFHAQAVGLAADVAALALCPLVTQAERRVDLLLDETRSGLPPFLAARPGLESGLMLVQYTAAALASEGKTLAHPATADSIPTSAGTEDHVSMAPWAARKLVQVVANARRVVACEALVAARALETRRPLTGGRGTEAVWRAVREVAPAGAGDRSPSPDLEHLAAWIAEGGPRRAVETAGLAWPRLFAAETAEARGAVA
jgi:histidine ammonia-lyase